MNIETVRQLSLKKLSAHQREQSKTPFVLHIGEDNARYWLENYKYSGFSKVFWTAPRFFGHGESIANLERATVIQYTNPWYFFVRCNFSEKLGRITTNFDEAYQNDTSFRFTFNTENIKAIVIDEVNEASLHLFLEHAKETMSLLRPDLVYMKQEYIGLLDKFIIQNYGLNPEYDFNVVHQLEASRQAKEVSYSVYLK